MTLKKTNLRVIKGKGFDLFQRQDHVFLELSKEHFLKMTRKAVFFKNKRSATKQVQGKYELLKNLHKEALTESGGPV